MSYSSDAISYLADFAHDLTRIVRAACADADAVVQCYVSGQLVDWQTPADGVVEFILPDAGASDVVFLLAVSAELAQSNLWHEAVPPLAGGNRISITVPLVMSLGPDAVVKILLEPAGAAAADEGVFSQVAFPRGFGAGGFALGRFGTAAYGWDASGAPGWGYGGGMGEYGFDCRMLRWTSEPMPPGSYPITVIVEDEAGNELARHSTLQQLDGPPRPASDLRVQSYDVLADALTLTWSRSPDV
ncbi:MAG: hypothetical protein ABFD92_09190 [Planctomycetaceae bacterium]|nr:hypothetical protein [Planctomycetaceae bacterium]